MPDEVGKAESAGRGSDLVVLPPAFSADWASRRILRMMKRTDWRPRRNDVPPAPRHAHSPDARTFRLDDPHPPPPRLLDDLRRVLARDDGDVDPRHRHALRLDDDRPGSRGLHVRLGGCRREGRRGDARLLAAPDALGPEPGGQLQPGLSFYALTRLPVGDVVTLTNTYPLWIVVLTCLAARRAPVLGDTLGVLVGVAGVALVGQPHLSGDHLAAVVARSARCRRRWR